MKLKKGAMQDYKLSKMQDTLVRLREAVQMIWSDIEAAEQELTAIKQSMDLPIGSFNVRGQKDFLEE